MLSIGSKVLSAFCILAGLEGVIPVPEDLNNEEEGRLRQLLEAHRAIMESLDVDEVLRRTLKAAASMVDAYDCVIASFDERGQATRLIGAGERRISDLLGSIEVADLTPLTRVERDPSRAGISHGKVRGFLGVPLRSHGDVYGALYLTGRADRPFTGDASDVVVALAGSAGAALENARLYQQLHRQLRWSTAMTEVSSALLSEDVSDAVGVVIARVATVVVAEVISVVIPDPESDQLLIHTSRGEGAERFEGRRYERQGSLVDRSLRSGQVVLATASEAPTSLEAEMGPSMILPVVVAGEPICALALTRSHGGELFAAADVDMAAEFATQVGLAIELARARSDRQRMELADERGRIARDLHDHVIQRLFGAGLSLQALGARYPAAEPALFEQVEAIDAAIGEIRTAVFTLTSRARTAAGTARHRILDVVSEMSDTLGSTPQLTFRGPVDLMLTDALVDDVLAVVRECLANVVRHASADSTAVNIAVEGGSVEVEVTDNGLGISPATARRSGTGNLADRARRRGGAFTLIAGERNGTRAVWRAPLASKRSRV